MLNYLKTWLFAAAAFCLTGYSVAETHGAAHQAASAQQASASQGASKAPSREEKSIIWRIRKDNQPTSYLVGTVHIGKQGSTLPADFQYVLKQSRQLVLETQIADEEYAKAHPEEVVKMLQMMVHNKSLNETLGGKTTMIVRRIFRESAIPEFADLMGNPQSQYSLAPWAIWFHLGYTSTPPDYSTDYGVESLLLKQARTRKLPVLGLEDIEPLEMMRTIPDDVAVRNIEYLIVRQDQMKQEQMELFQAYEQRDGDKLEELASDEESVSLVDPRDHEFMKRLNQQILGQRNRNWMPKLQQYLAQKPTLVAVGAAHLFGKDGLVTLLRERGYTVEPFVMGK